MNVVFNCPEFLVVDDFLQEKEFAEARRSFFAENLQITGHSQVKVFSVSDGTPLRGAAHYYRRDEDFNSLHGSLGVSKGTPWDGFITRLISLQKQLQFGPDEYEALSLTPWCYTQGTALTWHNDAAAGYAGAYTYYLHSEWKKTWAGHLLVAGKDLELGHYISPKPNRIVLMKAGVPHTVLRVDPNAGENCRLSLTGFFLRKLL